MTKDLISLIDLIERLRQIEHNDYRTDILVHTTDTAKRCRRALAAQVAEIERLREAFARAASADEGAADNG